ncbi:outer membrane autotransporter barrel domain protein [Nitratireductor indicus C115]|uniref:Outer membrane autotransporter barrel domain protein n=2 Tax=Nitratireductor indicus TaxID=721133 RepID=K2N7V1_9HYPH|nr:outer membrane autotransporter barrel domain protein [Nitratireductor indicus C115]
MAAGALPKTSELSEMPFRPDRAAIAAVWLILVAPVLVACVFGAAQSAAAQEVYDLAAVVSRQEARAASGEARQLSILGERLDNTRNLRGKGGNAASSMVKLQFRRGSGSQVSTRVLDTRSIQAQEKLRRTPRVAAWMGGEALISEARANDSRSSAFSTQGLAIGADMRLSPRLLIGALMGVAYDRTPLSTDLTYSASTVSTTLYGTVFTAPQTYLDFALGGMRSAYSGRAANSLHTPNASGDRVFALLRASRSFATGKVKMRGYGQGTLSSTRFGGATTGYGNDTARLTVGFSSEAPHSTERGRIRPHAGFEWSISQTRSTRPGANHEATYSASDDARLTAKAGLDLTLNPRATVKANYGISAGRNTSTPEQTVKARFSLRF